MKKFCMLLGFLPLLTQAQTVKKIIVEDYTGAWCIWCPEGTVILHTLEEKNQDQIIVFATHIDDKLEIPAGRTVAGTLGVKGFPSGSIDRSKLPGQSTIPLGRGSWTSSFNQRKSAQAIASVAFDNSSYSAETNKYEFDVNVQFSALALTNVPIVVNVYVLEDSIPATGNLVQKNASPSVQNGKNPLDDWYHNWTVRMALGGAWGYSGVIPTDPELNKTYTKHVSFNLPDGYKKENVRLVAYVAYNGDVADNAKEIINAEEMSLSTVGSTGISKPSSTSILNAYPNPVLQNDAMKIEYNIDKNTQVDLKVYNILGQLIATPYSSYEMTGIHTIQWRPSVSGLAKGTYILKIAASGQESQSIKVNVL